MRNYIRKLAHKIPVGKAYLFGPIHMEEELRDKITHAAHYYRVTQSEIVRRALATYFKTLDYKEPLK